MGGYRVILTLAVLLSAFCCSHPDAQDNGSTLDSRILPPRGYTRVEAEPGGFAEWLRNLPLKPENSPVHLFDGRLKGNQSAHFAVLDVDVGGNDLQQCADAVIRLRAEYLYSRGEYDAIHFNFTSGDEASFRNWIDGYRPDVEGNSVTWRISASSDSSYRCLRRYLDTVMMYAGTYSLSKELIHVKVVSGMRPGDVFIRGGFPGHAVLVVDMAVEVSTGEQVFLLAQSYMPAQDIHILKSFDNDISPWYRLDFGEILETPEWRFGRNELFRFRETRSYNE